MTTTEKLREALKGVEPGWHIADADSIRWRARRVQIKRRIAGAVAVAAAFATVAAFAPMIFRHGEPGTTAASLGAGGSVPTTAAQAEMVTQLSLRAGPLPGVKAVGNEVPVPYVSRSRVRLLPPAQGESGPGRFCGVLPQVKCQYLHRSQDGWVTEKAIESGVDEVDDFQAAAYWVVDGPVGAAVATIGGRRAPVDVRDLGDQYRLIGVRLPATREPAGYGVDVSAPDAVWVFDPDGRLIARHVQ